MTKLFECRERTTRAMLQSKSGMLFVFGDNMQRCDMGGQAKEMRGEQNVVGIPTKVPPSSDPSASPIRELQRANGIH